MATRKEQREQARAEREAREAAERASAQRKKRMVQLGGLLAGVAVIVVVLVVVSSGGSSKKGGSSEGEATGSQEAAQLLNGIPQRGITLGNPKAPVTLIEFADLQCPFCRDYTQKTFPTVVARYVRTGKVKMVFRNYAFIGPDSVTAARAAESAAQQNKLWNFIDVFYSNQGQENTDYVTDKFLEKIGNGVPGLDVQKMLSGREDPKVDQAIAEAQQEAQNAGVNSTPTFLVQKGNAAPQKVTASAFDPGQFTAALDKVISG